MSMDHVIDRVLPLKAFEVQQTPICPTLLVPHTVLNTAFEYQSLEQRTGGRKACYVLSRREKTPQDHLSMARHSAGRD